MKARRVKGLDPDMALADAAERIVRVRLAELNRLLGRDRAPNGFDGAAEDDHEAIAEVLHLVP